MLFGVTSGQL
ncbi:hypothetical protein LINPERHAP1_LOCUS31696 [Linum perenne]